ncbi:cardiolipin synthase B [Altererythrobacter fulvus]|uniref:phospholipase D-like domain-containing protein n=1 Tax=Caenibius fulvus TaxID=2126012 RepID=UPI0030183347
MESARPEPEGPAPFRDLDPFAIRAQGQKLTFFPKGGDRLAALLDLIETAQHSLQFYFYIFATDECAATVRDALAQAARRGVAVTLIVDDFGSTADAKFLQPLTDAGGIVQRFSSRWGVRYLIRNHQKMAIRDGEAAMIGGFNIEQAYFDPPEKNGWNDLGVLVEGDAVKRLCDWFGILARWTDDRQVHLLEARREVRRWNSGTTTVRWLLGGPSQALGPWARCIITDIAIASRLDIMVAYFSPRRGLVRRIGHVAQRGEARLLLAAKSDNAATVGAARANYGRLLRRGVEIHEFEPCKLHAKLFVVDDVTYIGSANFDMRSLYLNLEIMLRIEDKALAERMRTFIAQHLPHSTEVTPELHRQRRTVWNRIRWSLSWFLVTVVDYTVTRRLNLGL